MSHGTLQYTVLSKWKTVFFHDISRSNEGQKARTLHCVTYGHGFCRKRLISTSHSLFLLDREKHSSTACWLKAFPGKLYQRGLDGHCLLLIIHVSEARYINSLITFKHLEKTFLFLFVTAFFQEKKLYCGRF